MCADKLIGKWTLIDSKNFDGFLKELGVNEETIKIAESLKPTVIISRENSKWTVQIQTSYKSSQVSFELDKQFKLMTLYGREVDVMITLKDGGLHEVHTFDGKVINVTDRRVNEKDQMITTSTSGPAVTVRTYARAS